MSHTMLGVARGDEGAHMVAALKCQLMTSVTMSDGSTCISTPDTQSSNIFYIYILILTPFFVVHNSHWSKASQDPQPARPDVDA